MTRTTFLPEAVLPLLLAAADATFVPAQLWVLDTAFVVLDREAPAESGIARALDRMPQARITTGQRFTGMRDSIHRLVAAGTLVPGGKGQDAGYSVSPAFVRRGRQMLTALPLPEQTALRRAAQTFNDASRMLSKNSLASLPSGSAMI